VLEGQERALAGRDLLSEKSQQRLAKEETVAKLTTVKTLTERTSPGESARWFRRAKQHTSGRYCCHATVATMRVPHEITLDEAQDPEQKTGPKSSPV
jgi:hypothetical protein